MRFISTRGQTPALSFSEAVATGLAPDGGLFLPEELPRISAERADLASRDKNGGGEVERNLAAVNFLMSDLRQTGSDHQVPTVMPSRLW